MAQSIHMFLFLTSNFETGSISNFQLQLSDCKLAVRSINIHYTIVSSLQNFYLCFTIPFHSFFDFNIATLKVQGKPERLNI